MLSGPAGDQKTLADLEDLHIIRAKAADLEEARAYQNDLARYLASHAHSPDRENAVHSFVMAARRGGDEKSALRMGLTFEQEFAASESVPDVLDEELQAALSSEETLKEAPAMLQRWNRHGWLSAEDQIIDELRLSDAETAFGQQRRAEQRVMGLLKTTSEVQPDLQSAVQRQLANLKLTGKVVRDFKVTDADGQEQSLAQYRGKLVVIAFWASWCDPCREEMPQLRALHAAYKNKGVTILGINLDRNIEAFKKCIAEERLSWPQVADGQAWNTLLAKQFDVDAIPTTLLIDRDGRLYARGLDGDELKLAVDHLLGTSRSLPILENAQ
jgi:thiol-disulfide isomerase/thioredoxin